MVGMLVHKVKENLLPGEELITVISAFGNQLRLHESIKKGLWEYGWTGEEHKDNKAEYQKDVAYRGENRMKSV